MNDKANAFFTTNSIWSNVKTNLNNVQTTHKACQDNDPSIQYLKKFMADHLTIFYTYCGCEPVADLTTTTTPRSTTTAVPMCPC